MKTPLRYKRPWRNKTKEAISRAWKYAFASCILYLVSSIQYPASAQVYPVQGNAALVPPYSVHLTDYTSRTTDRLVLNIVLNNTTRPELPVRLRLKIEGQNIKIETKPEFIGSSIMLQGGIPLRLTGTDLAEYFNPAHLNFSGITQKEFQKTGALPQGFYQFCFEVLEYNRGVKISNTICAPGWLILNDPPIVNIPRNNEKVKPTIPQNVIFQWTPRHTGSPNSAFSTEYELTMVEVWPANRNPNDAILTSPPILETTTRSTSFIYGPAETPLEPGRRYAFRLRAKSIVGVEEYDLFKNNGYSEVYSFVYGDACGLPLNLSAEGTGSSRFRAKWDAEFNHTAFQVRYREAGNSSAEWFTTNAQLNDVEISSLKSNTTYEYQVAGTCGAFESAFTPIATVKTSSPPVAEYSCGLPIQNFNLDPASLTASLKTGDIIQAGDFQVELTRVTGSNGTFSGNGTVVVPFLNNVKVKAVFTNITVNKENRLVKGYMNVTGAALDIIPDEVTAMMDKLDEVLDEIEEGLNKAEEIADKIDNALDQADLVVNEIAAYLPDNILNEIKTARAEIVAARNEMKNAPTPEAKEAAKVKVRQARQRMKEGIGDAMKYYATAVKRFANIIWASIKELKEEIKNNTSEAEFNEAKKTLENLIYQDQSINMNQNGSDGLIMLGEVAATVRQIPDNKSEALKTTQQKLNAKKMAYYTFNVLNAFLNYYNSEGSVEKLKDDIEINGGILIKEVLTKMKEGQSDSDIKTHVKAFIKTKIENIAREIFE